MKSRSVKFSMLFALFAVSSLACGDWAQGQFRLFRHARTFRCVPVECVPVDCAPPTNVGPPVTSNVEPYHADSPQFPILATGYDGFFYHYDSSCCLDPVHYGTLSSLVPLTLGCTGSPPGSGSDFPPGPPGPTALMSLGATTFPRLDYWSIDRDAGNMPVAGDSLKPMTKDGKFCVFKIAHADFGDRKFIAFGVQRPLDKTILFLLARQYHPERDDRAFGTPVEIADAIVVDPGRLVHSRLVRDPAIRGPLSRADLKFADLPGPFGNGELEGDFHIVVGDLWPGITWPR